MTEMNRRDVLALSTGVGLWARFALAPGECRAGSDEGGKSRFAIPTDYLRQPEEIPVWWVSGYEEVQRYLEGRVSKGTVMLVGKSAGGRAIRGVAYGHARSGKGSTTFSGSLGFGDVRAWIGPDHARKVYLGMASVHGGEFEGIVGMVNLISVLETGRDLRGRAWPAISSVFERLDRVILIPVVNPDGRARVPIRMGVHRGTDETVAEYFNTGGRLDGSLIGWPECKEFIPLDFTRVQFPGGYPNDAGVNPQHDDFLGKPQPETRALLDLVAQERPDLTLNMHTGATFIHPLRTSVERELEATQEAFYRRVMTGLTAAGSQATDDPAEEADLARERPQVFNLDTVLNLHCGALAMLIESPSHMFSTAMREGRPFVPSPDQLLDYQLICHQEAMGFLADTGGRAKWTANPRTR